ncbi:bifunctional 3-phenylpropionate/cinnamic acid dioxygenase ferredoxin subunit [Streptomyces griseorubiginosus]|uniref:bifunctional 3-phenylpropionate/cinnamic acid dioxygenase ferredoxin subunit n=1 Tax=Streptomyces griseorubiginosus TaxID=67304 RepID=UPI0033A6911B
MSTHISVASPAGLPAVGDRRWVPLCPTVDVPEDEGRRIDTVPPVAAFRQNGEFFCIDDTCTHETYSLAEGWAENCVVECTLHFAKFSLRTGEPLAPPASEAVAVHPVAVVGDHLYGALPLGYLTRRPD